VGLAVSVDPDEDPKSANTIQGALLRFWATTSARLAVHHGATKGHENPEGMEAVKALAERWGSSTSTTRSRSSSPTRPWRSCSPPDGKISRYLYGVGFPAARPALRARRGERRGAWAPRSIACSSPVSGMTR
jgi:hypothetical protein